MYGIFPPPPPKQLGISRSAPSRSALFMRWPKVWNKKFQEFLGGFLQYTVWIIRKSQKKRSKAQEVGLNLFDSAPTSPSSA